MALFRLLSKRINFKKYQRKTSWKYLSFVFLNKLFLNLKLKVMLWNILIMKN